MASRVGIALAIFLGIASTAAAQVVRFETTVGDFDMVLNPRGLSQLQGHVDNLLQYVENGNYNGSWINRAGESGGRDFILQMGGLFSDTKRAPLTQRSIRPVARFAEIEGEPASELGLSNVRGTVAMALSAHPFLEDRSDQNSGTSSFFINVQDNPGLDVDFTVFASVSELTVVDQIMDLPNTDLSDTATHPLFNVPPNSLAFIDVPIAANTFQVFIKRAFVVSDAMTVAQAVAGAASFMENSVAAAAASASTLNAAASASGGSSSARLASLAVPEPASALIAMMAGFGLFAFGRRRR